MLFTVNDMFDGTSPSVKLYETVWMPGAVSVSPTSWMLSRSPSTESRSRRLGQVGRQARRRELGVRGRDARQGEGGGRVVPGERVQVLANETAGAVDVAVEGSDRRSERDKEERGHGDDGDNRARPPTPLVTAPCAHQLILFGGGCTDADRPLLTACSICPRRWG